MARASRKQLVSIFPHLSVHCRSSHQGSTSCM
uniref:Uncharacterized protein n=1 Tax=Anguilla anguilla TaxID=7936 RepID=A0A0E9VB66_ANGAN